jgi:hypothetical protein
MDLGRIVKWLVIFAIIFFAWKYAVPWIKRQGSGGGAATQQADGSCVGAAERASDGWGNGLRQFMNPPYDANAWSSFERDVQSSISRAESQCSCAAKSCETTRAALNDLRGFVSEMGTSIRTGSSPPSDAVGRQERIDNQIASARALVQSGQ